MIQAIIAYQHSAPSKSLLWCAGLYTTRIKRSSLTWKKGSEIHIFNENPR